MTTRPPSVGRRRSGIPGTARTPAHLLTPVLLATVALLSTLALLAATAPAAAADDVATDCAGTGGGAAFVADSGFTVYYNDTQPMPDSGVFLNDTAMAFRNVTLVANGTASLRLENGTGTATCYADVDATGTPITIVPADGGSNVRVDGEADVLSVGGATVGGGSVALAYDAPATLDVSIATGEPAGTDLEAEDADDGSTLDGVNVDADGWIDLTLPAGERRVTLVETGGGGGGGGGGSGGSGGAGSFGTASITVANASLSDEVVEPDEGVVVAVELVNEGDAAGTRGVAILVDGEATDSRTVTLNPGDGRTVSFELAFANSGEYAIAVNETAVGTVIVEVPATESTPQPEESTPTGTPESTESGDDPPSAPDETGSGLPVVPVIGVAAAGVVAAGGLLWLQRG